MAERMDKLDKAHQEDQTKLAAKLAAVEKAHRDDQAVLNQRVQQLQIEKKELTKKIEDLRSELQQG